MRVPLFTSLLPLLSLVLSFFLLLSSTSPVLSLSIPCNVSSPSPLNTIGCQLSTFTALPFTYSLTYDTFAIPPTLLVIGATLPYPTLSAYFLNGSLARGPFPSLYYPRSVTVDPYGNVFVIDQYIGIIAFSPYPAYTYQADLTPSFFGTLLGQGAAAVTPQGEFLYYTTTGGLLVYLLTFTAGRPSLATSVATLTVTPLSTAISVVVHPLTGQVCAFDASTTSLYLYTANYSRPTHPTFNLSTVYTANNSALSALLSTGYHTRLALSSITSTGQFLFGGEGPDIGSGFPLLLFLMLPNGSSPWPTTGPTMLLTPSTFPDSSALSPAFTASPDGSTIYIPTAGAALTGAGGGVYVVQGSTGADPGVGGISLPIFYDFNSSYMAYGSLPSSILFSPSQHYLTSTGYATDVPGVVLFGIQLVSSSPFDIAVVSFIDAGPLPPGVTLKSLTPSTTTCATSTAGLIGTLGSVTYLQCNYSLSWTAPVTGNVIVHIYTGRAVLGVVLSQQQYYIIIPLTGAFVFFNADTQFSVPLLLGSSPSTQHVYSNTAPLTYQPLFTGQAQIYSFSLRSGANDTTDVVYMGIPAGVVFSSLTNSTGCDPRLSAVVGTVVLTSLVGVSECDYSLSWSTPFSAQMGLYYTAIHPSLYDSISIYIVFAQSASAQQSRQYNPVLSYNGVNYPAPQGGSQVTVATVTTYTAGTATLTLQWNGDGGDIGFTFPSSWANSSLFSIIPVVGSAALCFVSGGGRLVLGYFQPTTQCVYTLTWLPGYIGSAQLTSDNSLQLTGPDSAGDGSFVFNFIAPTALGTACLLMYALPGNLDYPWSVALSMSFTYSPIPITTSFGTAVSMISGSGTRIFTNRFGTTFPTSVTLTGSSPTTNLWYINSSMPVDANGLTLTLGQPIQLPGLGPSPLFTQLTLYTSGGVFQESNSSQIDPFGTAFRSSVPGFLNQSMGASNVNSLAVSAASCSGPLTFTNGLRTPTQPSVSNGAALFNYSYTLSDGATYSVTASLTFTAVSAFAVSKDLLGSPYQILTSVTGVRTYTYLPTGDVLTSTVTGLNTSLLNTTLVLPSQHFYPYSLLASSPGTYSLNDVPFWDGNGVAFSVLPAVPALGLPLGQGLLSAVQLYIAFSPNMTSPVLTEAGYISIPLLSLQQQTYLFAS